MLMILCLELQMIGSGVRSGGHIYCESELTNSETEAIRNISWKCIRPIPKRLPTIKCNNLQGTFIVKMKTLVSKMLPIYALFNDYAKAWQNFELGK
jgi:hypothetical protein